MDFYYDSINMRFPEKGSVTAGVFTPSDTTANVGLTMDDSIILTTNFAGTTPKGVRYTADSFAGTFVYNINEFLYDIDEYIYNIGSAGAGVATHLLISRLSGTPNVQVWASDESITGYTKIFDSVIEDNEWSINAITQTSASYFVVQFTGTYNIDVAEIILAQKISDLYRYDRGWTEQFRPNVTLKGAYNGGEFANKNNIPLNDRSLNWGVLNQTHKNKIETLRNGVYNNGKYFLLVDDNRKFSKLQNNVVFNNVGYRHYSTSLQIRGTA